jgi:hypothetical protein
MIHHRKGKLCGQRRPLRTKPAHPQICRGQKALPMIDRARLFVSAIRLVHLIGVAACISGSAAVSAQAGDRWPPEICSDLSEMLAFDEQIWSDARPELLGIARADLLFILAHHCGVDTRAKKQADLAAAKAADRAQAADRRAAVPPPPSWNETAPMPAPRRTVPAHKPREPENCIVRDVGAGGVATLDCQ